MRDGNSLIMSGSGGGGSAASVTSVAFAESAEQANKVPWKGVKDVIAFNNEFNVVESNFDNENFWINYRSRDDDELTDAITDYYFGNGQKSISDVTLHAANVYASTAVSITSDARKKDVQSDCFINLDEIAAAPSVKFVWKDDESKRLQVGTIAQYWQRILPEVVSESSDGTLSMQYGVAALLSAISLAKEVQQLRDKIKDLEQQR